MLNALLVSSLLSAAPDVDLDALLGRLAESEHRREALDQDSELTSTLRTENLDDDGKVTAYSVKVERVTSRGGKQTRRVISCEANGKAVTEPDQMRRCSTGAKVAVSIDMSAGGDSPFSAEAQKSHVFSRVAGDATKVHFEAKKSGDEDALKGEAVVDLEHGQLKSLDYEPMVLPSMVKKMKVHQEYGLNTTMGPTVSLVRGEGEGQFLWMKIRLRTTTTISDLTMGHPDAGPPAAPPRKEVAE